MKRYVVLSLIAGCMFAQSLPRLIRFSGAAKDVTAVTGITFSLYAEQTGGAPLWSETQNVQPDRTGRYTVLLGATESDGLPAALFAAEQAHWVGVSIEGQPEQPRILLVSAPYALKAGDAETLGGLPPSAFLMAGGPAGRVESPSAGAQSAVGLASTSTGTADYVPLWTDSSGDLGNSAIFQSGSGDTARIGINTAKPKATLDVGGATNIAGPLTLPATGTATATGGFNSQPIELSTSVFNGNRSAAVNKSFQWQAEPVANGSTSAGASLNLLFGSGAGTPAETGLSIANNGRIAFAAGQTFPGTSALAAVTAGTDLTGGGASGNVTLNLDTTKVPQLAAANNTFTGTVTASSFSGNGAGLANVNASLLGGLASSAFAQLSAGNVLTGPLTVHNTTYMTGTNTSGVLQVTNAVTSGQGPAIVGTTDSSAAAAIKGIVANESGTEAGVFGQTSSFSGYGVYGQSPAVGVYGSANGASTLGQSFGLAGVWGDTNGYVGVLGTADDYGAASFYNNSNSAPTLLATNYETSSATAPVFATIGTGFDNRGCYIDANGDLFCEGTLTGVVPAGGQKVSVYATQSTESWIEDTGSAQLSAGSARIAFDPAFARTVNTAVDYEVFLTPKGDCEGLYVGNQTPEGFEVHELRGGRSNVAFAYRIMAKRAGSETVRLVDVTERYKQMHLQQQTLRERMAERRALEKRNLP